MHTGDIHARIAACAVFVFVPGTLALVWLVRTPPEELGCGMQSTATRERVMDAWLAGAGPIVAAGALVVLLVIAQVSRWRGAARGGNRGPGRTSLLIVAPLTVFVIACGIDTAIFVPAAITWAWLYVFAPVSAPAIAFAVARWVRRQPRGERALAGLQALGWCSLMLGITGVGAMVGGAGMGRIYC